MAKFGSGERPLTILKTWWQEIWGTKPVPPPEPSKPTRRPVDNNAIRARIGAQGWRLLELPIRKSGPTGQVARWKVTAVKGERSIEVGGTTIDEALQKVGVSLGVIPRN